MAALNDLVDHYRPILKESRPPPPAMSGSYDHFIPVETEQGAGARLIARVVEWWEIYLLLYPANKKILRYTVMRGYHMHGREQFGFDVAENFSSGRVQFFKPSAQVVCRLSKPTAENFISARCEAVLHHRIVLFVGQELRDWGVG